MQMLGFFECLIDYNDASLYWGKLPEAMICLCHSYQNIWFQICSTFLGEFSVTPSENGPSSFPGARASEDGWRSLCSEPVKTIDGNLAAVFKNCCCYFCKDKKNQCITKVHEM